jgi:hypothetical protein
MEVKNRADWRKSRKETLDTSAIEEEKEDVEEEEKKKKWTEGTRRAHGGDKKKCQVSLRLPSHMGCRRIAPFILNLGARCS